MQAEQPIAELLRRTGELRRASEQSQQRLGEAEKCLSDHEKGLRQLDSAVREFNARFTSGSAHPGCGADFGASVTGGAAGASASTVLPRVSVAPESHDISSLHFERPRGLWKLYHEKFLLDWKMRTTPKTQPLGLRTSGTTCPAAHPSWISSLLWLSYSRPRLQMPPTILVASIARPQRLSASSYGH